MQQMLPTEVVLQPVNTQQPLTSSDRLCVENYMSPVRSALTALGDLPGISALLGKGQSLFDAPPTSFSAYGQPVNLQAAFSSPWLHQYRLGATHSPAKHVSFSAATRGPSAANAENSLLGKRSYQPGPPNPPGSGPPARLVILAPAGQMVSASASEMQQHHQQHQQRPYNQVAPNHQQRQHIQQRPHSQQMQVAPPLRESQNSPPRSRLSSSLSLKQQPSQPQQHNKKHLSTNRAVQSLPAALEGRSYDLTQDNDFEYDALDDLADTFVEPQLQLQSSWGVQASKATSKRPSGAAAGKLPLSFGFGGAFGNK
jgi:hypothetical protein